MTSHRGRYDSTCHLFTLFHPGHLTYYQLIGPTQYEDRGYYRYNLAGGCRTPNALDRL